VDRRLAFLGRPRETKTASARSGKDLLRQSETAYELEQMILAQVRANRLCRDDLSVDAFSARTNLFRHFLYCTFLSAGLL
jgi:hypothetical protein